MSVRLNSFLCSSLVSTVIALSASQPVHASGNPEFVKFALGQAHKRGFEGCDSAIKEVFKDANGDDIRVIAGAIPALKSNSIRMTSTFGVAGDTIFMDVVIRKEGAVCYTNQTSVLYIAESCAETNRQSTMFKVQAETLGNIFLKSSGGVDLILRPVGNGCLETYVLDQSF